MDSPAVPEHVVVRELDGEAILLNLETETYFGLDEVGTRIWTELAACASVEKACAVLEKEFAVEPSVLRSDVRRLVAELVETGLLVLRAGQEPNQSQPSSEDRR
ncbi:MAG TPA: PqqD family protein [Thermoanaerobaculia bacterium]|nr:PqqD family protein [Thermoanaerobaculia bacterium]